MASNFYSRPRRVSAFSAGLDDTREDQASIPTGTFECRKAKFLFLHTQFHKKRQPCASPERGAFFPRSTIYKIKKIKNEIYAIVFLRNFVFMLQR